MLKQYCIVCNRKVDLRKKGSSQLRKEFCIDVKNPEYHYVCSKECKQKFREKLGIQNIISNDEKRILGKKR